MIQIQIILNTIFFSLLWYKYWPTSLSNDWKRTKQEFGTQEFPENKRATWQTAKCFQTLGGPDYLTGQSEVQTD